MVPLFVIMTTYGAIGYGKVVKLTTICFQWIAAQHRYVEHHIHGVRT